MFCVSFFDFLRNRKRVPEGRLFLREGPSVATGARLTEDARDGAFGIDMTKSSCYFFNMKRALSTVLTDRGQVSIPAAIRKKANLRVGQRLQWRLAAPGCFSVTVDAAPKKRLRAVDVIGYAQRFSPDETLGRTDDVMRMLRQGEK